MPWRLSSPLVVGGHGGILGLSSWEFQHLYSATASPHHCQIDLFSGHNLIYDKSIIRAPHFISESFSTIFTISEACTHAKCIPICIWGKRCSIDILLSIPSLTRQSFSENTAQALPITLSRDISASLLVASWKHCDSSSGVRTLIPPFKVKHATFSRQHHPFSCSLPFSTFPGSRFWT